MAGSCKGGTENSVSIAKSNVLTAWATFSYLSRVLLCPVELVDRLVASDPKNITICDRQWQIMAGASELYLQINESATVNLCI